MKYTVCETCKTPYSIKGSHYDCPVCFLKLEEAELMEEAEMEQVDSYILEEDPIAWDYVDVMWGDS